ncbi:DUF1934 domain-containing protein [Paenibacillus nasutitermitis]|uniref:DUF1934 domain-containing protein n=1 Tax=Paenibacillus nasutitermitis TaxID=1652958 RepID=A0A917E290_9BACL|nr:DUF1934 domain-containing protein [Paenibacillus nasutitermitis]GGD95696.1 hypothetical protein GCM10010911_62940 [Paenibacillus nasutitermitis]
MTGRAKVQITLTSELDGERQTHAFIGEWFRKDRTVYVRYEESDENGQVRTLVRWREGELSVKRHGDVESDQTFAAGMRRVGHYTSTHIRFQLETDTTLLWMQCGDMATGNPLGKPQEEPMAPSLPMLLEWHYRLWVDEQPTGMFIVRLHAEEQKDKPAGDNV